MTKQQDIEQAVKKMEDAYHKINALISKHGPSMLDKNGEKLSYEELNKIYNEEHDAYMEWRQAAEEYKRLTSQKSDENQEAHNV